MKKSWVTWAFLTVVVVAVFIAFNYDRGQKAVPLAEIFPEEEAYPVDLEYEFVNDASTSVSEDLGELASLQQPTAQKVAETTEAAIAQKKEELKITTPANIAVGKYTIQVASFNTKVSAELELEKLNKKGMTGKVAEKNLGEKGTWYRLYVGQFDTKESAENSLASIKKDYKNSFVILNK